MALLALLIALAAGPLLASQHTEPLLERLRHGSLAERRTALSELAKQGDSASVPALVETLRDDDTVSRKLAEHALWAIWMRSGDSQVDGLLDLGVRLMSGGNLEMAVEAFAQVIQLRPGFAEGYNKRATALYHMGRYQDSLDDIAETLRRNPYHFGALSGAGLCLLGLQRPREALDYFGKALRINPNLEGIVELKKQVEKKMRKPVT